MVLGSTATFCHTLANTLEAADDWFTMDNDPVPLLYTLRSAVISAWTPPDLELDQTDHTSD
ncbi:hypothetical protein [Paenibacillus planticolens]|uniref:hypothetical protein n=1 Tax=Paenibacillus planticolens TaxID=2654976 RepID=UPI0014916735|nr:hypothetical protein [Paenibacillus planticolens]